jgi:hypothetical protein
MRFFHPGDVDSGRFSPGSSRRRRERFRQQEAEHAARRAGLSALGPTEVIAVKRITIDRTRYEPGQPLTLEGLVLGELLQRNEVWAPSTPDWWGAPGRILAAEPCDAHTHSSAPSAGALRIAQGCAYDPGNAVYRYHTAFNEHTQHTAAFLRFGGGNPFECPTQIDGRANPNAARAYVWTADVLHHHVDYYLGDTGLGPRPRRDQVVIRHYHGSMMDRATAKRYGVTGQITTNEIQHPIAHRIKDDALGALLLGARLTLCALRPDRMHWLPIPVPVARYKALRVLPGERSRLRTSVGESGGSVTAGQHARPFRIAHSPTKAAYKGSAAFMSAIQRLQARGLAVEPVLIERTTHAESLRLKATCDAVFDSFWLGIQGSGLEGAAMGLPVIAGDPDVAELYRQHVGEVPYTFANDATELEAAIERLVVDAPWRRAEAKRVGRYVAAYHDYAAVARRYEGILAKALGRDDVRTP